MQILSAIKWLIEQFPNSVRGFMGFLLLFFCGLIITIIFLDKRVSSLQLKVDACTDSKYREIMAIKDSLARDERKRNDTIRYENEILKQRLEEVKELSFKLKSTLK